VETLNQSQPAHHGGWMVFGQETLFHWIPVRYKPSTYTYLPNSHL
jgi:hypothetical protein